MRGKRDALRGRCVHTIHATGTAQLSDVFSWLAKGCTICIHHSNIKLARSSFAPDPITEKSKEEFGPKSRFLI